MNRRSLFGSVALLAVAFLVFGVTLGNPLYFDDLTILRENLWLKGGVPLWHWFGSAFADPARHFPAYRPLLMMSFAANVRWFGDSVEGLRVVNLLLHVANALLLTRIFLALLREKSLSWVAWGAAFLFLLHPLQTLPVNFLWKRSELLVVFFVLAGLALHLRERTRGGVYRWPIVAAQVALLLLGSASKESGVLLPAFLLLADLCLAEGRRDLFGRRSAFLYGLLLAGVSFFLWFRLGVVDRWVDLFTDPLVEDRRSVGRWAYFLASLEVFPQYLSLWLVPRPRILDDPSPLTSFPWGGSFVTLLSLVLTVLLSIRFRRQPIVPFSLGLFWIGLLPTTWFHPLYLVMDQIRLYLPLAGLGMLLTWALRAAARRTGVRPLLLVSLVGISYGGMTFLQNLRYDDPSEIWSDVTAVYPESGMAWEALGVSLENVGRHDEADRAFAAAASAEPNVPSYRVRAMLKPLERLTPEERGKRLDRIDTSGLDGRQLMNLAIWEAGQGEEARAEAHFLEGARRYPSLRLVHYNLGVFWERTGKTEEARRAFANALILDPGDPRSRAALDRLGGPP